MIFNEILISQDFFTKTNVTRKRSVVGNPRLSQKNIFIFYMLFIKKSNVINIFYQFHITQNRHNSNININNNNKKKY